MGVKKKTDLNFFHRKLGRKRSPLAADRKPLPAAVPPNDCATDTRVHAEDKFNAH